MRVAVDTRPLAVHGTGIGTYLKALLSGLAAHPGEVDVTGIHFSLKHPVPAPEWWPAGWRWQGGRFPWSLQRSWWPRVPHPTVRFWTGPVDVVHSVSPFILPPGRIPLVVTVHDIGFLKLPETRLGELSDVVVARFVRSLKEAASIVAVSAFTARETADFLGLAPERIRVVHSALPPFLTTAPLSGRPASVGEPFFLSLGAVEPRKNLELLIEAWSLLARTGRPPLLLHCGPDRSSHADSLRQLVRRHHLAERVEFLGYLAAPEVRGLMARATALLFPSRYEGFGYPLLEAFRAGCPVVSSTAASLPEVAGEAALFADPGDPGGWAEAVRRLAADPGARADLAARGKERLGAFTLEAMAEGHLAAYRDALR